MRGSRSTTWRTNGSPRTAEGLAISDQTGEWHDDFLRDVASVSDGFQVQTNIVRQDGRRGVLISIFKNGKCIDAGVSTAFGDFAPRRARCRRS